MSNQTFVKGKGGMKDECGDRLVALLVRRAMLWILE